MHAHHTKSLSDSGKSILAALLDTSKGQEVALSAPVLSENDLIYLSNQYPSSKILRSEYVEVSVSGSTSRGRLVLLNDCLVILELGACKALHFLPFKLTAINVDAADHHSGISLLYSELGSSSATIIRVKSLTNNATFGEALMEAKNEFSAKARSGGGHSTFYVFTSVLSSSSYSIYFQVKVSLLYANKDILSCISFIHLHSPCLFTIE
jgi:hypothetical protein